MKWATQEQAGRKGAKEKKEKNEQLWFMLESVGDTQGEWNAFSRSAKSYLVPKEDNKSWHTRVN